MKIHYLQHVPFEGPAYIETWLEENQHVISATRFYEAEAVLPDPKELDGLIIMGGPMGVYDEAIYPWLKTEKTFIKNCIEQNVKVLGICLGAQLIAASLGAPVHRAPNKEIGWFPVMTAPACRLFPWLHELFKDGPTVFHWHGDQFEIPAGALNLLDSIANRNQAFAYQDNVLGLQFHLEVDRHHLADLIHNCWADLDEAPYVQHMNQLMMDSKNAVATRGIMTTLLNEFIGTVAVPQP